MAAYFDERGRQVAGLFANEPLEFSRFRRELSLARLPLAA
jgi:hypothetical protein